MIVIEKNKTCAVTGHRQVDSDLDKNLLETLFIRLIQKGFNTFLIGMAVGFDTICFKILYKLKQKYDIKLIACVPCPNQDERFSQSQKEEYRNLLEKADHVEIISQRYYAGCMRKRNEFMVDNSSVLIAYVRRDKSGAMQTLSYAKQKNLAILKV